MISKQKINKTFLLVGFSAIYKQEVVPNTTQKFPGLSTGLFYRKLSYYFLCQLLQTLNTYQLSILT